DLIVSRIRTGPCPAISTRDTDLSRRPIRWRSGYLTSPPGVRRYRAYSILREDSTFFAVHPSWLLSDGGCPRRASRVHFRYETATVNGRDRANRPATRCIRRGTLSAHPPRRSRGPVFKPIAAPSPMTALPDSAVAALESSLPTGRLRRGVPPAPLTTFRIGGPADLVFQPTSAAGLVEVL